MEKIVKLNRLFILKTDFYKAISIVQNTLYDYCYHKMFWIATKFKNVFKVAFKVQYEMHTARNYIDLMSVHVSHFPKTDFF